MTYEELRRESKIEEIIATLWLIAAILAFSQGARIFGYFFLCKSAVDHCCVVYYTILGICAKRETNDGK